MAELLIAQKRVEAQPLLYLRRNIESALLSGLFADCFPKLFEYAGAHGIEVTGQPVARYIDTATEYWTVDCAVPISGSAAADEDFQTGNLPAGLVAWAIHEGDYGGLPETNAAIGMWIESNGFRKAGHPWESYLTSPADYPDVADWKTEVCWPIERAT